MSKLRRIYNDDSQFYFITCRSYKGIRIFIKDKSFKILIGSLKYLQKENYFNLYAWVVLCDHLHLLLEIIGKNNISQIMHDFKSYTTNQISKEILFSRGIRNTKDVLIFG